MRTGPYIALLSTIILLTANCRAGITIGGHHLALDTLSGTLLCSVPQAVFGNDYRAKIVADNSDGTPLWSDITIDGTNVPNGKKFTFTDVAADRRYAVKARCADGSLINAELAFTFLPVLSFDGTIEKTYTVHSCRLLLPEGNDLMLRAKVKFRGGYTNQSAFHKRNYHVKFIDDNGDKLDISSLGIRNDNSWILDAGTVDVIRLRNRVLTDLWLDICTLPYYSEYSPKAHTGARGRLVEVVRDGEYQGVYNLCENIDRKATGLTRYDPTTGAVYGVLYKEKSATPESLMIACNDPDSLSDTWGGIEAKYPTVDDLGYTYWEPMRELVDLTANADDPTFVKHIGRHLDLPAMADYFVLIQCVLGFDNMSKNIYWACRDANVDRRLSPVVWDLDATLGQSWTMAYYHPAYLAPTVDLLTDFTNKVPRLFTRLITTDPQGFNRRCTRRFRALRHNAFHPDSVVARFDAYLNELKRSGAHAREQQRWHLSSDLYGHTPFPDDELPFIHDWLTKRLDYLDRQVFTTEATRGDLNNDSLIDVSDLNLLLTDMLNGFSHIDEADLNGDGIIDVADVNILFNIMLGLR